MGAFTVAPFLVPAAQADPPRNAPAYGRRAKDKQGKKDKKYKKDERRDRDDRKDRDREGYNRDRYDNDRDYRDRYNRDQRNNRSNSSFSGTVTAVRSGNSFDLRANGRTYNVYLSSRLPRELSRGDEVRVYGRPYGVNDIRSATVRVTKNTGADPRRDEPRRDNNQSGNSYRTTSGVVTTVRSSREFDVRIDGKIYNVTASSGTRGLSRGDEVRIYGQSYGANDIRNATVRITRNR